MYCLPPRLAKREEEKLAEVKDEETKKLSKSETTGKKHDLAQEGQNGRELTGVVKGCYHSRLLIDT